MMRHQGITSNNGHLFSVGPQSTRLGEKLLENISFTNINNIFGHFVSAS